MPLNTSNSSASIIDPSPDANHDGVEDGILPPPGNAIAAGDDNNYYKAYRMNLVTGGYSLTLEASKCGAYRLTARFNLTSDPPGFYRWYGDELNGQGIHKRDFAVVVSPGNIRSLRMYEANPLSALATGTQPNQRGTLDAMVSGLPAGAGPRSDAIFAFGSARTASRASGSETSYDPDNFNDRKSGSSTKLRHQHPPRGFA